MALYQGVISGIWLAFVGWFLLQAAAAEGRFLAARQALEGLRVGDLTCATRSWCPRPLLGRFMGEVAWGRPFPVYPVVEDGRALGLVSVNSVMEVLRVEGRPARARPHAAQRERSDPRARGGADRRPPGVRRRGAVRVRRGRGRSARRRALRLDAARALEPAAAADACEGRSRSRPRPGGERVEHRLAVAFELRRPDAGDLRELAGSARPAHGDLGSVVSWKTT